MSFTCACIIAFSSAILTSAAACCPGRSLSITARRCAGRVSGSGSDDMRHTVHRCMATINSPTSILPSRDSSLRSQIFAITG